MWADDHGARRRSSLSPALRRRALPAPRADRGAARTVGAAARPARHAPRLPQRRSLSGDHAGRRVPSQPAHPVVDVLRHDDTPAGDGAGLRRGDREEHHAEAAPGPSAAEPRAHHHARGARARQLQRLSQSRPRGLSPRPALPAPPRPAHRPGPALFGRTLENGGRLREKFGDSIEIIATGGIDAPEKALAALRAGATACAYFTGFITRGPFLARRILDALVKARR